MAMSPEEYIQSVDLTGTPRPIVEQAAEFDPSAAVFDQARTQAQVVGSGVFSFAPGVSTEARQAISDSLLLAQLVANKRGNVVSQPIRWFDEYVTALAGLGWTTSSSAWTDYSKSGTAADVHQQVLAVLSAALGPAPAALAIITSAVGALKAMDPKSSWLRLFSRESEHAEFARFQLGAVESEGDTVAISMVACVIVASSTITQVLFFKFRQENASFQANNTRVTTSTASLVKRHPLVEAKVSAYQDNYLSSITDL